MEDGLLGLAKGGSHQWTPRVWQTNEIALTPVGNTCLYSVVGGFVLGYAKVRLDSAGSSGVQIWVSLPVPYIDLRQQNDPNFSLFLGQGEYLDVGTAGRRFWLMGVGSDGTGAPDKRAVWASCRANSTIAGSPDASLGGAGGASSFAIASPDEMSFSFMYPALTSL